MTDFETALASFVAGANRMLDEGINKSHPNPLYTKKIKPEEGRRYVRLTISEGPNEQCRSAWGFIDKTTGAVLKAAGWKTPAKNFARGNIFDDKNGLGRFCWTGIR